MPHWFHIINAVVKLFYSNLVSWGIITQSRPNGIQSERGIRNGGYKFGTLKSTQCLLM